jgi:hypothetical protein
MKDNPDKRKNAKREKEKALREKIPEETRKFSVPKCPYRILGPSNNIHNMYRGFLGGGG